jgi:hypothetical protein
MRNTQQILNKWRFWLAAVALSLVMLMLAACGTPTTTGGGQGVTPTAPLTTQNCGTLHSNHAGLISSDKSLAPQAENCFYSAFHACHPATLTYETTSVDTGIINNLQVKTTTGTCSVFDGVQHFIAPNPPGAITTYACGAASLQSDGLHILTCGDAGDIVVPAK